MFSLLDPSLTDRILELFERFHYWGPFALLMLCGLGAPLPEEAALVGSGILLYQGHVEFLPITLVCSIAILLGDSIPYWLGRRWGLAALRKKWFAKILHPERFAAFERRFAEHGNWAIFTCRFLPGLRIPGYFVAGTLGMAYFRFLLIDTLGVLLSVPASIFAGKWFGGQIDRLREYVHDLHLWLALAVAMVVAAFLLRAWKKHRQAGRSGPPDPGATGL